uniref:Uncharacterized protein n=1 Tax=Calidris pygmaea TaxID=425635 RepID=A0A8C3J0D4_9CHAR
MATSTEVGGPILTHPGAPLGFFWGGGHTYTHIRGWGGDAGRSRGDTQRMGVPLHPRLVAPLGGNGTPLCQHQPPVIPPTDSHPPTHTHIPPKFCFAAPGVTHVIVREDPYRVSGDQMALGLLAGAATGAALGSFMWMPCWF